MPEQKTVPTGQDVREFLDQISDEGRRKDSYALVELMKDITGEEPVLWRGGIVGFGRYHYKYASGHEGDSCLAAFAPRKDKLTLYTYPWSDERQQLLDKLGKYKSGVGCVYIKRLSDVDPDALRELVTQSVEQIKSIYPDSA